MRKCQNKTRILNISFENKEVYEQYKNYIEIAIIFSNNVQRIKDLISVLDDTSKELFEKICDKIQTKEIIELDENSKFEIWNEIENLIRNFRIQNGLCRKKH